MGGTKRQVKKAGGRKEGVAQKIHKGRAGGAINQAGQVKTGTWIDAGSSIHGLLFKLEAKQFSRERIMEEDDEGRTRKGARS